jgi:hypothetical protein
MPTDGSIKEENIKHSINILIVKFQHIFVSVSAIFFLASLFLINGFSSSFVSESRILYEEDTRFWDLQSLAKQTRLPTSYVGSAPVRRFFLCFWCGSPQWDKGSSFTRFLDNTKRRTTISRTPLDDWSARHKDLYLTTHNRQTSTPPVELELTISVGERMQTYALDRGATTGTAKTFIRGRKKGKTSPYLHLHFVFSFIYSQCLGWHTEEKLDFGLRGLLMVNSRFIPHQDKLLRKLD